MVKKIVTAGLTAGAMLMIALPAFAGHRSHHQMPTVNDATVTNVVSSAAETGFNQQDDTASVTKASHSLAGAGTVGGSKTIATGVASSNATGYVTVNVDPCDRCSHHESGASINKATVYNGVESAALTGGNTQNETATVKKAHGSAAIAAGVSFGGGSKTISTGVAGSSATGWVATNVH